MSFDMKMKMPWTSFIVLAWSVYLYATSANADGGIRLPKFPLAMRLDTFLSEIATGYTYEELYFIFDGPTIVPLEAFTSTLTAENSSLINPQVIRRLDGRFPGGSCTVRISLLQLVEQRSQSKRAIFEFTSDSGVYTRIYYFTTMPDEYLAEFQCIGFENWICKTGFFVNLYPVRAPPNQFDWMRAVGDIKRQVGLDFTDPRSVYGLRTADPCPESHS